MIITTVLQKNMCNFTIGKPIKIRMKNKELKILLVDDDPDILEIVGINLELEKYQIFKATNGKDAIKIAKKQHPHLIILDVMMPGMNGVETCEALRQIPELEHTVITFLSARNEDFTQLAGFEAGADDYIAKPIKPKVLVSKVKALLRRYKKPKNNARENLKIGTFEIDVEAYTIKNKEKVHTVTRKEFELFHLLASTPDKVFRREEILKEIWGDDVVVGDRTIDVHIRKLREKFGDKVIKTLKGVGYKFNEDGK